MLSIMDFAKNRTISYQDEIKSAYFGAKQVTIHPVVCFFKKDNRLIRDSVIFISDDINHDYHAVNNFSKLARQHVQTLLGRKPVKEVIFSDGCASQYKSKGPLADLSIRTHEVNRNYYGSEHGKGQGDGEIGVLNRALDCAVMGRKLIINTAEDMYSWCGANLTLEDEFSRRHFYFVRSEEIQRDRPFTNTSTVPGTRKLHQIQNIVGKPYHLLARELSCFCPACFSGRRGPCSNEAYVGNFRVKVLKPMPATVYSLTG